MIAVIDWCIMDAGLDRQKKLAQQEADVLHRISRDIYPVAWRNCPQHRAMILGMDLLGVQRGHVKSIEANHRSICEYVNRLWQIYGPQPTIRIAARLVWEIKEGSGITWREFSIYAALLSWIGKRSRAWVSRSVLQRRSLGYKTASMMQAELPNRLDGEEPLTARQIGYILDKLHERQFFARVRKDPWHTYYSVRLTQDQLEKALLDSAVYAPGFHHRRVQRTAAFMARLRAARKGANVDTANVDNAAPECPRSVHGVSTECPRECPHHCPLSVHINRNLY
jgi:hypothetical protein